MRNPLGLSKIFLSLVLFAFSVTFATAQDLIDESLPASGLQAASPESAKSLEQASLGTQVVSAAETSTDAATSSQPAVNDPLQSLGQGHWGHVLALSALSLAPAILLMTTCFVRITVVLGLLRQAIGMNQLPPTQVLTALSLFMTALVMTPVWTDIYHEAIVPFQEARASGSTADVPWEALWANGVRPLRRFMSRQIDRAGNDADVWLFYDYLPESRQRSTPTTYDDIPLQALLPAFLLSELKVAFLIGFQICLPFLIVDLVVASVTTSMGMMMVPPSVVSLPLKLLLFVLLDGWRLIVGMLLESFAPY